MKIRKWGGEWEWREVGMVCVCLCVGFVCVTFVAFFTIQPLMLRAWLNSHLRMFLFFWTRKNVTVRRYEYDLCWALVEQSKFVCQNQLSRSSVFVCVCWCFNISICCISGNVVKKVVVFFKISESLSRAKTIYTSKKVVNSCCFLYWVVVCVCVVVRQKKLGWKFFTFFFGWLF